jgi:tetratricopeptide (TPR) repeat protein
MLYKFSYALLLISGGVLCAQTGPDLYRRRSMDPPPPTAKIPQADQSPWDDGLNPDRSTDHRFATPDSFGSTTDMNWGSFGEDQSNYNTPAATVNVAELRHPLSSKAQKLLEKGHNLAQKDKHDEAIAIYKQALKEPSAVPYAHSLLGAEYIRQGHAKDAADELALAVTQLPVPSNYSNLGLALLLTGDLQRSEEQTRRALNMDHNSPQTHYILGVVLMEKNSADPAALTELQAAAKVLPTARLAVALYYFRNNEMAAAQEQLQSYTADAPKLSLAQRWLRVAARENPRVALGFIDTSTLEATN